MKKKIFIIVGIVVFLLVAGVGTWYVTGSEVFYPEHLKIGKFIAVNNTEKCYIYDMEKGAFTGDYFTVEFKTKGFADGDGKKIGENGHGNLIFNDEEVSADEMWVLYNDDGKYGVITYIANNVDLTNIETEGIVKTGIDYTFYYSNDFSELKMIGIFEDGKNPVMGVVGDSLEDAEELLKNLQ